MKRLLLITILQILILSNISAQALPIGIDGRYDDWENASSTYTDSQNDGAEIDLLSFKVSNDSNYLFIHFALSEEIELDENHQIFLQIDTDNNAGTGYSVNGIGAELGIDFGNKQAYFSYESSTITVHQGDIKLIALPTVTSDTFEIAIGRDVLPDGIHPLFTNNTIKLCFIDNDTNGDFMPNEGETFSYTFDETPIEIYDYKNLNKNNTTDIRLMTYNTLYDGLISNNPQRVAAFQRIITAVNPDIITFNECWDTEWYHTKNLLNEWLPIQSEGTWECWEVNDGNITCSKFDITDNYAILSGSRIAASVIDLPSSYPRDIIIINSHFKCCGGTSNNSKRQREADAIINFIRDIKTPGGALTMPYGTPFIISGDLNLVSESQQLTTLLTGDIVNNNEFGEDINPDWDDSDLNDVISFHTDERMAFTWIENSSDYWPGRLDFAISTNEGSTVSKAFTIYTGNMSAERLSEFNLFATDTDIASDHLPKVTDFIIEDAIENIFNLNKSGEINIYPNPSVNGLFSINTDDNNTIKEVQVYNLLGQNLFSIKNINNNSYHLDISQYKTGIYFVEISTNIFTESFKLIK